MTGMLMVMFNTTKSSYHALSENVTQTTMAMARFSLSAMRAKQSEKKRIRNLSKIRF